MLPMASSIGPTSPVSRVRERPRKAIAPKVHRIELNATAKGSSTPRRLPLNSHSTKAMTTMLSGNTKRRSRTMPW